MPEEYLVFKGGIYMELVNKGTECPFLCWSCRKKFFSFDCPHNSIPFFDTILFEKLIQTMIKKATQIKTDGKLVSARPAVKAEIPGTIFLAKENAGCPKADVLVKEGDHVNLGQTIGMRHASGYDEPILATCSGTYSGLEKHYYRNGKLTNFLKIENDGLDTYDESVRERSDEDIASLSKEDIIQILKDRSVTGLGGSSFPTYVKLDTGKNIGTILVNAVECEPYVCADSLLIRDEFDSVVGGIKTVMQALDCHDARICIRKKDVDLMNFCISGLNELGEHDIVVCPVKNFYPQGWEPALIKSALNLEMEEGMVPEDYGVMSFNVSTFWAIWKAVKYNLPVYERYVSVSGDGINTPTNFIARVGTQASSLIGQCGGFKGDKDKIVVLGGPMSGTSIQKDDGIITKGVACLYVADSVEYKEETCIRCGSCVMSCPVHLQPVSIMNAMKSMPVDKDKVKQLEPLKCIECGLCTYACTCGINVMDYVKRAKVVAKLK